MLSVRVSCSSTEFGPICCNDTSLAVSDFSPYICSLFALKRKTHNASNRVQTRYTARALLAPATHTHTHTHTHTQCCTLHLCKGRVPVQRQRPTLMVLRIGARQTVCLPCVPTMHDACCRRFHGVRVSLSPNALTLCCQCVSFFSCTVSFFPMSVTVSLLSLPAVSQATLSQCVSARALPLTSPSGYIASTASWDHNLGTQRCPWVIKAQVRTTPCVARRTRHVLRVTLDVSRVARLSFFW